MSQARLASERRGVRTHSEAVEQFRRPFAPGAIGFRIMRQLPAGDGQSAGTVVVAPYVRAQSVLVRLNSIVPGRWSQRFDEFQLDLNQIGGGARLFLICRLTVTLPREAGGPDVDVTYEDVGEADTVASHPVKALYSDARKRAAAAAGIGTYLYTTLPETDLSAGAAVGQVARAADGELALTAVATRHLRESYKQQVTTAAMREEFGEILAHGEPHDGPADPDRTAPPRADQTSAAPAPTDGADGSGQDRGETGTLGGWGGRHPTPPPAPVALVTPGQAAEPIRRSPAAVADAPAMSADHLEAIYREADAAQVSSGALANIVLRLSGRPPVDEQSASREFDSGLLTRTPDALLPRVLAAVRGREAGDDVPATRPSQDAVELPLDFGVLSDDGA